MKLKDVLKLAPGDEVFWNDPDDGVCSRTLTIRMIAVLSADEEDFDSELDADAIVLIDAADGSSLECFAHELS